MSGSPSQVDGGASPLVFASAWGSDEDKKERQRQHVRRSYYRKLTRLQAMREQVRRLEDAYEAALRRQRELDESPAHLLAAGLPSSSEALAHLYTRLSILRDDLRRENEELEALVRQHARFQENVLRYARELQQANQQQQQTSEERDNSMAGLQFKTMTVEECHEIASSSFQELGRFMKSHSYQSTGHQVLGWRDRRQVDNDQVKFLLTKMFLGFTPVEVMNRAWDVMTDPDGMKAMYSASMNMTVKRLQVVNDDNIVLYRVITGPDGLSQVKSLFLATRFQVGDDYLLLYRSLDQKRLVELGDDDSPESTGAHLSTAVRSEVWMDIFSWNVFKDTEEGGNQCEFSCGGIVPSTASTSAQMWLLEVLLLALRWEARVVGPIFTLKG